MVCLFWDIDGTLLSTARAGVFALEEALEQLAGRRVDLQTLPTAGLTDREVAAACLGAAGLDSTPESVDRVLSLYESFLPRALPRRVGRVLPGVREILEALPADRADSFLLTGNTRAGARAKLAHYNLEQFFKDGAFGDEAADRPAIARRAYARALLRHPAAAPERCFVIGDTPHDIACGRAIGARTIAVGTGGYSVAALREHDPWWVVDRFPEPGVFLDKVGLRGKAC
jgi:phosphoglycolate phosphatase-like HAD superfamily hydrolase